VGSLKNKDFMFRSALLLTALSSSFPYDRAERVMPNDRIAPPLALPPPGVYEGPACPLNFIYTNRDYPGLPEGSARRVLPTLIYNPEGEKLPVSSLQHSVWLNGIAVQALIGSLRIYFREKCFSSPPSPLWSSPHPFMHDWREYIFQKIIPVIIYSEMVKTGGGDCWSAATHSIHLSLLQQLESGRRFSIQQLSLKSIQGKYHQLVLYNVNALIPSSATPEENMIFFQNKTAAEIFFKEIERNFKKADRTKNIELCDAWGDFIGHPSHWPNTIGYNFLKPTDSWHSVTVTSYSLPSFRNVEAPGKNSNDFIVTAQARHEIKSTLLELLHFFNIDYEKPPELKKILSQLREMMAIYCKDKTVQQLYRRYRDMREMQM
jgi:hypothetical protein